MPGAVAKKKRKDDLSQEDRFLQFVDVASSWAQVHTRAVLVGAVVLVLIVVGTVYYRSYQESLRTRAAIELNQLRVSLSPADALPRLTGFVARYDGTPSADDGRVLLARMHLQAGQPRDVIEVLGPLASEPVDRPTGYVTATLLAEAYKEAGESDRALDKLDEIAEGAYVPYQRHRALAEKGRLLAELGRYEESVATYRLLVEDEGAADDLYRVRLGEVQALMASGSAAEGSAATFAAPTAGAPEELEIGDPSESGSAASPIDSAAPDSVLDPPPDSPDDSSP